MKKLLLLCVCLLALAGSLRAQTAAPDIVVVRIQDYQTSAKIFITRDEGKTEKIEVNIKGTAYEKGMTSVNEAYYSVLKKLYQEGYTLQNSSSVSAGDGVGRVIYVFVKSQ